jgi:hypothetical protein
VLPRTRSTLGRPLNHYTTSEEMLVGRPIVTFEGIPNSHQYEELLYGGDLYFLEFLKEAVRPSALLRRLKLIRCAVEQLETFGLEETALAWDDIWLPPHGLPNVGIPNTSIKYTEGMFGTPFVDYLAPIWEGGLVHETLVARRQAFMLFVEVNQLVPWSVLEYPPAIQLGLFRSCSRFDGFSPAWPTDFRPFLPSIEGPETKLTSSNVLPGNVFVDLNPAAMFLRAMQYLSTLGNIEEFLADHGLEQTLGHVVANLPDYARWTLHFCHNFRLNFSSDAFAVVEPSGKELPYFHSFNKARSGQDLVWAALAEIQGVSLNPTQNPTAQTQIRYYCLRARFVNWDWTSIAVDISALWDAGVTTGCMDASFWMQTILRALNIPTYVCRVDLRHWTISSQGTAHVGQQGQEHTTLYSPFLNMALRHGDDIYQGFAFPNFVVLPMDALPGMHKWWDLPLLQRTTAPACLSPPHDILRLEADYQKLHRAVLSVAIPPYDAVARQWFCKKASWHSAIYKGSAGCSDSGEVTLAHFEDLAAKGEYLAQDLTPGSIAQIRQQMKDPCSTYNFHRREPLLEGCQATPFDEPNGHDGNCSK